MEGGCDMEGCGLIFMGRGARVFWAFTGSGDKALSEGAWAGSWPAVEDCDNDSLVDS